MWIRKSGLQTTARVLVRRSHPKPLATVSTPVTWKELEKGVQLEDFKIDNVRQRIAKVGDLWKGLRTDKPADLEAVFEKYK